MEISCLVQNLKCYILVSSAAVGRTTVVAIITTIANAVTLPSLKSRRRRDLRVAHSMFWSDDNRLLFRRQSTSRENTFPPTNEFWKSKKKNKENKKIPRLITARWSRCFHQTA